MNHSINNCCLQQSGETNKRKGGEEKTRKRIFKKKIAKKEKALVNFYSRVDRVGQSGGGEVGIQHQLTGIEELGCFKGRVWGAKERKTSRPSIYVFYRDFDKAGKLQLTRGGGTKVLRQKIIRVLSDMGKLRESSRNSRS